MLIPLRTDEPTRKPYIVTVLLIAINVAVFVYQQLSSYIHGVDLAAIYGAVPAELMRNIDLPPPSPYSPYLSLLTYMFMHGGFVHVISNMLFLNTFGPNIEDMMGHFKFLMFYILCGVVSAIVYILPNFNLIIPLVGASGAIAGVMGAHLRALPGTRIVCLLIFIPIRLPAVVILFPWILLQFYNVGMSGQSNIAWLAHIGGFILGIFLVKGFRKKWFRRSSHSPIDL